MIGTLYVRSDLAETIFQQAELHELVFAWRQIYSVPNNA